MQNSNTKFPEENNFFDSGANLGSKLGFIISSSYLVGYLFTFVLLPIVRGESLNILTLEAEQIVRSIAFFLLILLVGFIIGILPATILGMVTGGIYGLLIKQFHSKLSLLSLRVLLLLFGVTFAVFVNIMIFRPSMDPEPRYWYYLLLGVPSILYVIFCGYLAVRLTNGLENTLA